MLTVRPRPGRSIPATRPATRKYGPRTLVSNLVCNAAMPWSTVSADGKFPALLTMMSAAPHCRTSESTDSAAAISAATNRAFGPMAATARSAPGPLRGAVGHLGRHPVLEAGGVDGHVLTVDGNDHALVEHRTEIAGLGVGHHFARIAGCCEARPDEIVHACLVRPGDIDHAIDRVAGRRAGDRGRDIGSRDRLERPVRRPNRVTVDERIGNAVDELEELSGTHDRIGSPRLHDQLLLGDLGPHVAAFGRPLGPHDRQRDMVPDSGGPLRPEPIGG